HGGRRSRPLDCRVRDLRDTLCTHPGPESREPMIRIALLAAVMLALDASGAEPAHSHHQAGPYAGQQARGVKALSDEEVSGYLAGAGMGFAKAAELNGYPGPMHS